MNHLLLGFFLISFVVAQQENKPDPVEVFRSICYLHPVKIQSVSSGKYLTFPFLSEEGVENMEQISIEFKEIPSEGENLFFGMTAMPEALDDDGIPSRIIFFPCAEVHQMMKTSLFIDLVGVENGVTEGASIMKYSLKKNQFFVDPETETPVILPHEIGVEFFEGVKFIDAIHKVSEEGGSPIREEFSEVFDLSEENMKRKFEYFPIVSRRKQEEENGLLEEKYDRIVFLTDAHISTHPNIYYQFYYGEGEQLTTIEDLVKRMKLVVNRLSDIEKEEDTKKKKKTLYVFLGDMTDRGTREDFHSLHLAIQASGIRHEDCIVIPGNHDLYSFLGISGTYLPSMEMFYKQFFGIDIISLKNNKMMMTSFVEGYDVNVNGKEYSLVFVDTCEEVTKGSATVWGSFTGSQDLRKVLESARKKKGTKKVVVLLHQSWEDLRVGGEELVDCLLEYEDVIEVILCGHHHGDKEYQFADLGGKIKVRMLAAFFKEVLIDGTVIQSENVLNSSLSFVLE